MKTELPLLDETKELLANRPHSLKTATIAESIGASKAWVNMIANGRITNPGYETLLKLNNYLKQQIK